MKRAKMIAAGGLMLIAVLSETTNAGLADEREMTRGPVPSSGVTPSDVETTELSDTPPWLELELTTGPVCCHVACHEYGCFCMDCQMTPGPECPSGMIPIEDCPDGGGSGGAGEDSGQLTGDPVVVVVDDPDGLDAAFVAEVERLQADFPADEPLNVEQAEALLDALYYDGFDGELNEKWRSYVLFKHAVALQHPETTEESRNAINDGLRDYWDACAPEEARELEVSFAHLMRLVSEPDQELLSGLEAAGEGYTGDTYLATAPDLTLASGCEWVCWEECVCVCDPPPCVCYCWIECFWLCP